jgi:hypothetical protein
MPDYVGGDSVGRDSYKQTGSHNKMTITNQAEVSSAEIDAAASELRAFIAELYDRGMIGSDGSVIDPAGVVEAVQSEPGRLRALATAIAGGARDAVLELVKGGVADLVIALVGQQVP